MADNAAKIQELEAVLRALQTEFTETESDDLKKLLVKEIDEVIEELITLKGKTSLQQSLIVIPENQRIDGVKSSPGDL